VVVLDQAGTRVTSGDFEIKLELQGDRGKLKGHSTQRTRSGVAGFDDLKVDEAGDYQLRAATGSLPAVESQSFKVLEGDDHHGGHHHHHGED
jgi:hypothetical protein